MKANAAADLTDLIQVLVLIKIIVILLVIEFYSVECSENATLIAAIEMTIILVETAGIRIVLLVFRLRSQLLRCEQVCKIIGTLAAVLTDLYRQLVAAGKGQVAPSEYGATLRNISGMKLQMYSMMRVQTVQHGLRKLM